MIDGFSEENPTEKLWCSSQEVNRDIHGCSHQKKKAKMLVNALYIRLTNR